MFTLAVSLLVSSLAQSADKVVVVPLGGTNVYIDPRNIVSFYNSLGDGIKVIFTVPADKHFVLTDIIGQGDLSLFENNTRKLMTKLGFIAHDNRQYPTTITLSSGIVFAPGAEVGVSGSSYSPYGDFTFSGYYY
jgi:hypothetical protein